MSLSWYFHSFHSPDLEHKILQGPGIYAADGEADHIPLTLREELRLAAFDYNKLPQSYWGYIDRYLTSSILALPETAQVSPDHAHGRVWAELAGLDQAEPKEVFDALSSGGRRYKVIEKKKSFFETLKSAYEGLVGKNSPDYIIIQGEELKIFIQRLEEIFDSTDDGFFEDFGGREALKPYFLEPFVRAYGRGKVILVMLT